MPEPSEENAKILIVDDQESNLRLLEHTVRRGGFTEVTTTTRPHEVLLMQQKSVYDLIILDLQMPGRNGFEVMSDLKGLDQSQRPVVLVMSADPAQSGRALREGADSFLSKPFILTEVQARVRSLIDARRSAVPV